MNTQADLNSFVSDKSAALLLQKLGSLQGNCLVVADENWAQTHWGNIANPKCTITVVSNRYDIASSASATGLDCQFNDFDFSALADHSFDALLYRVSKERASSHHIINQAGALLKPGGRLLLSGEKNEGVKTYVKQACARFGDRTNSEKHGTCYQASVQVHELSPNPLDDKNYPTLRLIQPSAGQKFYSKPGIFGWDKVDRGSEFLIKYLPQFIDSYDHRPQSLLDLGCGYGYLSCAASKLRFNQITATDNNAAALAAAEKNLSGLKDINYSIVAADAGDRVEDRFDALLCNPPFHQGFSVDGTLGSKFLNGAKRLLAPAGRALFVVNTFIPLEHRAKQHFDRVEVMANNGSFKLIALGNGR
jgi:16S rRNA (guanine1207-N2)-methyltransferase